MRRSPASHCCHVRQVVCTSAPAAVWDRPAASRAARISPGVGLRDGEPPRERFGWLGIPVFGVGFDQGDPVVGDFHRPVFLAVGDSGGFVDGAVDGDEAGFFEGGEVGIAVDLGEVAAGFVAGGELGEDADLFGSVHFWPQPLIPEARLQRRVA